MTRKDIATKVAAWTDLDQAEAYLAVQAILGSLTASLLRGEKVELRGFGSFRIRARKTCIGRNPKTGEHVDVPAQKVIHFKPGRGLNKPME